MTAMEDFYPAFLHYAVAMRLFEDTCRQLLNFQGSLEERNQIVDETARLALCVGDNIDDVESLLAPAAEEVAGDPVLSEALSLISNTIREDRARADSYSRWVTLKRIGGYDRAPRRPQVANPFWPLVQDSEDDSSSQPYDDFGEGEETEDDSEDGGTKGPEREAVMPRKPEDDGPEEDCDEEPEDDSEDDSEDDGPEDREVPCAEPEGEDDPDGDEDVDCDFDSKDSKAGRFFFDDDEDVDCGERTENEDLSNPLVKESHQIMSENATRRHPVGPAHRMEIRGAPVTARRPVARTPFRRMVRRRWLSRSCSPLR